MISEILLAHPLCGSTYFQWQHCLAFLATVAFCKGFFSGTVGLKRVYSLNRVVISGNSLTHFNVSSIVLIFFWYSVQQFFIQHCFVETMREMSRNITRYLYSSHSPDSAKDQKPWQVRILRKLKRWIINLLLDILVCSITVNFYSFVFCLVKIYSNTTHKMSNKIEVFLVCWLRKLKGINSVSSMPLSDKGFVNSSSKRFASLRLMWKPLCVHFN